ncbi:hypothetical protein BDZ45DRAFT_736227 [Acephala macrosclerotiorum]|nr:hypothetical protein BDZ45DRAFT_736227 [Acephala macrosclerotiorum]
MAQRIPLINGARNPSELESTSCDQDLLDEASSMIHSHRPVSPLSAVHPSSDSLFNKADSESPSSDPEDSRSNPPRQEGRPKYVKWGIHWQQPSYVLFCTFSGIALALGHHFYYKSLDGIIAGSARKQQWAITFGTTFAFLVVHLLTAATVIAHSQYIWSMVRQRGFTLETLDNLFTMTSDPRAFFNLEILKHGQIAVYGYCFRHSSWNSVRGPGIPKSNDPDLMAIFELYVCGRNLSGSWQSRSLPGWITDEENLGPPPSIIRVATDTAYEMGVLPITPPYINSSYSMQFYGPSLQCNSPNATQRLVFDYYSQQLFNQSYNNETGVYIVTPQIDLSVFNNTVHEMLEGNLTGSWWQPLVFSAFAPTEGCPGWLPEPQQGKGGCPVIDQFNNWNVDLPANFHDLVTYQANITANGDFVGVDTNSYAFKDIASLSSFDNETFTSQQLWITTTSSDIVCILGNASFELGFEYVDGVQSVSRNITDFKPVYMVSLAEELNLIRHLTGGRLWPEIPAYGSIFTAFTNLLSGNITMAMSDGWRGTHEATILEMATQSSKAMLTGLISCEDMAPDFWFDPKNMDRYFAPNYNITGHAHTDVFEQPSWMCRNGTLAPAIEDLFNNITISMLSANISGTPNQTIPVTTFSTHNIYQYNSLNLILSYGIAIAVALLSIAIGTYATIQNGVSHSTSFSATIATTRNVQLDRLVEGSSLGALPLDRDVRKTKVMFGELIDGDGHIAFGFEDGVQGLRKGGSYH